MNYSQTLDFLFSQLPMYQRVGAPAFKKDLTNTFALCSAVGDPQNRFKSIHVAGTNGKGSVCHMLASIFQCAGYTVGLYTSPHLKDFRERIKVNGTVIPEQDVVSFVETMKDDIEKIGPSFFEMTVAMAFDHFAKSNVDVAIVEVGLGGRLDSTNIITPELSVITNIGLDHQQFLGKTAQEIAFEKAGIIKPGVPVVVGEFQDVVAEVFEKRSEEKQSSLRFADREWEMRQAQIEDGRLSVTLRHYDGRTMTVHSQLTGPYQPKNILTVLEAVSVLNESEWRLSKDAFKEGVRTVIDRTGLMGRWQIIGQHPLTICDTGHNKEGLQPNIARLQSSFAPHNMHFVLGMVNDKNAEKILSLFPQRATYYFCRPDVPRGKDVASLCAAATAMGLKGNPYPSVRLAMAAARDCAGRADVIYIGGSTFVVAEAI